MTEQTKIEQTRATLIEHLLEFRRRLFIAVAAFFVAFGCSYLFAENIYQFLTQPLVDALPDPESRRIIFTGLLEVFFTYIKLSMFMAFILAFPVIATQFYLFLAPGLYKNERYAMAPYLILSPVLFLAGAAMAYYGVFPVAWKYFISFESTHATGQLPMILEPKVNEYLTIVMQLMIAFGLAMQLPIALSLLARAGIVKASTLARGRKYALILIVTAAAILTPPDVISQIALSIPLYLLYELSILLARVVEKRREKENHA